jgi:hypothetical protein
MIKFFKISFILVSLFFVINNLNAQDLKNKSKVKQRKISCNCNQAIKITLNKAIKYGPTQDTVGFGSQEIPKKQKGSKFYFEQEHNTAWYYIDVKLSGNLILDIIPTDTTNDLDLFCLIK